MNVISSDRDSGILKQVEMAQRGSTQEMTSLLEKHRRMIELLASRLCCACVSQEELIQAGSLGFMYALERYDASRDVKLATYAVPWILGEMRRTIRKTEAGVYSLDKEIDEEGQTLYDVLIGEEGVNLQYMDLNLALEKLRWEERLVICLRYYRDKTQRESALLLGKSQAQISRIERYALDTLFRLLS